MSLKRKKHLNVFESIKSSYLQGIRHETNILKFKKDKDFLGKDINPAQSVKDFGDTTANKHLQKTVYLENQSRRNNLRFEGLMEDDGASETRENFNTGFKMNVDLDGFTQHSQSSRSGVSCVAIYTILKRRTNTKPSCPENKYEVCGENYEEAETSVLILDLAKAENLRSLTCTAGGLIGLINPTSARLILPLIVTEEIFRLKPSTNASYDKLTTTSK
ncbi:hypothetical protein pdam_00002465 [Pocillopora damicornis]|uniref:Uncharacterized protein n=1 Tax=Pocillopora damicornis TaxID=46731 RepID=A0A3M6TRX8_POCDA|nr:hypothetical protein pdam_00002465 [Pocillopora damicornis]